MASSCIEVTLSVDCSLVEVRFFVVASGEDDKTTAKHCVTAAALPAGEAQQQAAASKDEEKIDNICIDPAALAEQYTVLCAELQQKCEALCPLVPVSAKPKVAALSDVKLKAIGPCIEGRRESLEALVKDICGGVPEEKEDIRVAVKNIIFQEAVRKSYTHEKQQLKTANVMEDGQVSLLWRWEVKKPSCLGEQKAAALGVRGWLKKAIKLFRGKAHGTLQQRQEAAYKKAQTHEHPGTPPAAVEASRIAVPDDENVQMLDAAGTEEVKCTQTQPKEAEGTKQCSPTVPCADATVETKPVSPADDDVVMVDSPELPQKETDIKEGASASPQKSTRKSAGKDENAAAAALGFGKKRSLEKSRGMMEMFVRRAAPKTKPTPKPSIEEEEKPTEAPAETETVEVLEGVKHISEALQSKESFDVESDWKTLLGGRWKSLGESMKNSRVPGLPPPFARKADAPRDPAKLAAMVLQSSDGQGVRTWRRKLFHFPADGNRPPFYGSFSRHSRIVGARKVFLKDPNLDYEIMSDEEWEEEPEGEDIIDNDAEDEEGGMDEEEDEDGSFMVADGYLSDDERAVNGGDSDGEDGLQSMCATDTAAPLAKEQFLHSVLNESVTSYLNALLNAKNSNQPVIISREPGLVTSIQGQKIRGPDLLEAMTFNIIGEGRARAYEMGKEPNATQQTTGKHAVVDLVSATPDVKGQEGGALQPKVLQYIPSSSTADNAHTATGTGQKAPSGLAGKPSLAQNVSAAGLQPVVKKRRRIQAIPDTEPDREGKKPSSAARACDILAVNRPAAAAAKCVPLTGSVPDLPGTSATTHCSDAAAAADTCAAVDETLHACPAEPARAVRVSQECPQPGQGTGEIERWMEENPDRLRLPGGMGGDSLQPQAAHSWLSPQTRSDRLEDPPSSSTPSRIHAYAAHLSPIKSPYIQVVCSSPKSIPIRVRGTAGQVFKDLSNISCQPSGSVLLDVSSPPCTPKDPLGGVNLNKSVLDSGMCRLQLNSKESAPAGPLKAIDLCSTPLGDDDDKNLQAALLASMHEPSDYNEPGEENMLGSDVMADHQPVARQRIPDAHRLAVIYTSGINLRDEREQIYGEVCSHLKECFQNPLKTFTSWRALATYMTVLASRRKSPGRNHMQPFFLKIHKLIDIHASRVPESMLLALAQASLCDSNTFLQQRAMFSLATCAARFLDNPENVTTYRTRNNRISLYTFTAHRGLLRTLHRRLARSLVEIEEAVRSGVATDQTRRHMLLSYHAVHMFSIAVAVPGHAGARLSSLLAGSGLQVPGSNFMSVLARLVEATTTLESNVEGVTDSANDITSASFRLLRCVLQHCSAPSEGVAEKPFTQQESVCLFVNLIKDGFSLERSPHRQALVVGCIHGMLSVSADSTQKAHAADFLVALGECCQVPGDGARSRATIVLKKFLRSVFGPRLGECVQVATEMLKLFRCLLSLADQHKTLATAAWQALMGAHKMPGGIQTTLTSAKQASWIQAIGQEIDRYKNKVSEENVPADVEHFVLMQTAFRSLEDQAEAQKGKLDAPPVLQQKRSGPRAVMPKGELPFTVPRPAAMKPGVAGALKPLRDLPEGEEGTGTGFKKRNAPLMVQFAGQSKGTKMLRRAVGPK